MNNKNEYLSALYFEYPGVASLTYPSMKNKKSAVVIRVGSGVHVQ